MSTGFDLLLAPDVTFDVERFDWAAPDRLELTGRWSGVRGLRFVRPVLTVVVEGRRRRLVALLEHKPWPAADGEPWTAAFAWAGGREDVGPARLEVGPTLVVELPPPGPELPDAPAARRPSAAEAALKRAEEAEARAAREKAAAQALLARERGEAQALLARERAEQERVRLELEDDLAATRALVEDLRMRLAAQEARLGDALAAAREEADALRVQLATVRADGLAREHQLGEQRDAAAAERDALLAERDQVLAQRNAVVDQLRAAQRRADDVGEREQLEAELGQERHRARRLQRRLEAAGAAPPKAEPEIGAVAASEAGPPGDGAAVEDAGPAAPVAGPRPGRRQIDLTGRDRTHRQGGPPPPLLVAAEPLRRRSPPAMMALRAALAVLVVAVLVALVLLVL